jgi:hypothetical protein
VRRSLLLPFVQTTYIYVYYLTLYTWDETSRIDDASINVVNTVKERDPVIIVSNLNLTMQSETPRIVSSFVILSAHNRFESSQ